MSDDTGFTLIGVAAAWGIIGVLTWGTPRSMTAFAACSIIGAIVVAREDKTNE